MEDVVRYVLILLEATTVPAAVDMNLLDKTAMVKCIKTISYKNVLS